jgi:DNA helicase HerA-like ATPase
MGATGSDAFYMQLLNDVMRRVRASLTLDAIRVGIDNSQMSAAQRSLAGTRLDFAARFVDDARALRALLRPGRLIVVDVRDEFIEKDQALGLFVTMLNVFSGAGMDEDSFNKLIVFDEAHKYMGAGPLINHVVEVIREMRHKGVSVVVASQDPVNVPAAVIELSSMICLHRFNAPSWLKHIQRSVAALSELTPQMMQGLGSGEAFMWASRATDQTFTRRPVRVKIRPRASRHGGSTRRATGL